jgi:O-antigen ligase
MQQTQTGNKLIFSAALLSVALLAIWIGYEPIAKRLGAVRQGASEYSIVSRTEYWRASWRIFRDHPITGVGLGAFPAIYPAYGRSSVKQERLEQTHNDYLQLLTDAGLLGALLGLWFIFEIIRSARRQWPQLAQARSHDRALIIGGYVAMLGIAVHSFLDFNLQIAANALVFLLIVALTTAIEPRSAHRSNEEPYR